KRVLALAGKSGTFSSRREDDERDLDFLGFLIFSDPIRSSAKEAIAACQDAGIEIKMLTGDHLLTAHAVADQVGIRHDHQLLFTGAMLETMSESRRREAYLKGMIFARLRPEEKFEMLRGLRAAGKVVAMTGDGVNDAPALKYADIGISMGKDATDVAKSSAQMILMKNDFAGIVEAVFEGRRIFSNLKNSFSYLISFHVPVVLFSLIPPLFNWPAVLMPLHLVTLHILVHPISAFAFENLEKRAQRTRQKGLLSRGQMIEAFSSGAVLTVLAVLLFLWPGHSPETARSLVYALILFGNVFFVFAGVLRSRQEGFTTALMSPRLWVCAAGVVLFAVICTRFAPAAALFHLEVLSWPTLAGLFGLSSLASVWRLLLFFRK
ncbi:MAG: cation-transporting P-type ATPase, partial [Spirochaetia bacterium]|nr:cation-transporting P-type ATPase [Spirochaetia bacterium]